MAADDDDDGLRPARGVLNGVILGLILWLLAAVLMLVLSGCGDPDPPKDKTCYRCSTTSTGYVQQPYSCDASEWAREGRDCRSRTGIRF